jgi:hypothetical protein
LFPSSNCCVAQWPDLYTKRRRKWQAQPFSADDWKIQNERSAPQRYDVLTISNFKGLNFMTTLNIATITRSSTEIKQAENAALLPNNFHE